MQIQQNWHMKKEFNLVHVIMTLALAFSFTTFIFNFDKRIDGNSLEVNHIKERHDLDIKAMKSQRMEDQQRIEKSLSSIDQKLDKIDDKLSEK